MMALVKSSTEFMTSSFAEPIALGVLGEGEHSEETKKATVEKVGKAIPKMMEDMMKAYNDDKAAKDDAAFAVLAAGADGISLENFIEFNIDESELQKKACEAWGFPGQEAWMAKIGE